jgi:hypothetical protein
LLRAKQAYELTVYFISKVSGKTSSNNASRSPAATANARRRRRNGQQSQIIRLLRLLRRRTDFLDVQTRDQGVQCQLVRTPSMTPQLVVRPEAEVTGVQRLAEPLPPGRLAAQQNIPQISMYAFGRGRGAILIAQRYNQQLRDHYLQYQEHLQQQQFLQQQQHQQIFQYEQFQQDINELVDLPELIPIGDMEGSLEDINED